jgi:hypothetical protein
MRRALATPDSADAAVAANHPPERGAHAPCGQLDLASCGLPKEEPWIVAPGGIE